MTILFYNTKAYISEGQFAEAVLVCGNTIAAVGRREDLLHAAGSDCRLVDCGGRIMVPGFNDSHMHLMEFGEGLRQAQIQNADSVEELIRVCVDFAKAYPERVRYGLHAAGWNHDRFTDRRMPDRHDLDRISTEVPVILERICGHILCANTKAIELLGLTEDAPQYWDGRFFGDACLHVRKLIPEFTQEERLQILEEAMQYAASRGVTCVQSNDVGAMGGSAQEGFDLLHRLYDEDRGVIRYRHQVNFDSPDEFRVCLEEGEFAHRTERYPEGSLLSLGPLKMYKDGSLGARTALMKHGYKNAPQEHGLEWLDDGTMMEYLRLASEHGIQAVTHCIGDAAVEKTAECYIRCNREVLGTEGNPLRHGLVHCQMTDASIPEKMGEHGLLGLVQPVFLKADIGILDELVDPGLAQTSYAFASLIRSCGERISLGTDCPVEDCDPFQNIYYAVTRNGFTPQERITVSQAVDAYTAGSAYAMFMEDRLGRIRPGHLADLVLLDRDVFACDWEEIPQTRPVMTMVDGRIVFTQE